ncbi:ABC transporter permease [Clostridium rectalis]|uniref:ABC transporter permease n=1 Tax=Clostridium rectalis TaxID=2040295 RepID=UPI000F63BAF3|nr:FtsX-like permease family protein [Clostridium rectalis]
MYIIKNSLKNIIRNKGRNILLGIIMIAILSCVAISIIINTTSDDIINSYKNKFGSEVFIQANREKIEEKINSGDTKVLDEGIPNEILEKLSKSKYIKETVFSSSYRGYSDTIKALDQQKNEKSNGFTEMNIVDKNNKKNKNSKIANLNILGGLNPSGRDEFKNGTRKIVGGKMPINEGECIISENFAKLNNLKIGDKFKVQNPNNPDKYAPLKLTVSGLYYDGSKNENVGFKHPMVNRKNEIITTYDTLKKYNNEIKDFNNFIIDAKYFLKNPDLLENFNKEAHEKGLNDLYEISTDKENYNNIVKPIEGLKNVSNTFMFVVLGFGGSILVLISILGIRERKYEIGVLRAMGMKKGTVALGLVFETTCMIIISLILGLSIGNLLSQPISNTLLQGQLEAQKQASSSVIGGVVSINATPTTPPIENLTVYLNCEAIILIIGVALLLGTISIGIGILYIMRYEPMKILSERN